ncbi:MAG: phosphonate transporter substrate-binding protein [Phycisphaerales bacterium]|nr:phosphonate transporter substrate-binding protein [Phycisphaerales bacterium]
MYEGSRLIGRQGLCASGFRRGIAATRLVLWLCLIVAIGFVAREARHTILTNSDKKSTLEDAVRNTGLRDVMPKRLASQFTDVQGRLLADPPVSADQLLDPQTVVVAHLPGGDPETPGVDWAKFEAHLSAAIGRKVEDEIFDNGPADLTRIKEGKITLVALHGVDAPFLVNNYGYQPAAVLGDETGASGNHLDILVPPTSPISNSAQLRGHNLVCTVPSSITGYRAAIALLAQNEGLRPAADYSIVWSLGQKKSITGIAKSKYEAAAVSDDKLQSLLKKGSVSTSDFRVIYKSQEIPRTTIGWFYNLKPNLAAKIQIAILAYRPDKPADTAKADASDADGSDASDTKPLHFIAIDYRKNFQLIRDIDDRFDPRLDMKAIKAPKGTPATQPATSGD